MMKGDLMGITTDELKTQLKSIVKVLVDRGEIRSYSSNKSIYETGSVSEIRWKGAIGTIIENSPEPVTMQITVCPTCRTKLAEWGQIGEGRMYIKCPNCQDIYEPNPVYGAEPRLFKKYRVRIEVEE